MYAIVKNVAKPPRTSRPTEERRAEISKNRSKPFLGVRAVESTVASDGAVDMPGIVSDGCRPGKDRPCYKKGVSSTKPRIEPLDPPMVPFALAGMAAFAVAGIVLLLVGGRREWLWTCLAGVLLGIPGLLAMLRHDANRRRRRALSHPDFKVTDEP
jgi:uncharacterized protein DUF2530